MGAGTGIVIADSVVVGSWTTDGKIDGSGRARFRMRVEKGAISGWCNSVGEVWGAVPGCAE